MFKALLFASALAAMASSSVGAVSCADGEQQMSVEGVNGVFCVAGSPCIATYSTGACPDVQSGLPYGSYCGVVASGVYGCKTHEAPTDAPVTEQPAATDVATDAPTELPAATDAATDTPTVLPVTPAPSASVTDSSCSAESVQVSVQGVNGSYCALDPICVDEISTGNCPGSQVGLLYGSYCAQIETGVYGCKPYTNVDQPTQVTYSAPLDCTDSPAGDTPVSIVSATQSYCASGPVCAGSIFGNCPKIQDGLLQDSKCMLIDTGVYGCVFMAST